MNNKNLHLITKNKGFPLFYAGLTHKLCDEYCVERNIFRLFSFINERSFSEKVMRRNQKLIVDSGAFTFWKIKNNLTKSSKKMQNMSIDEYLNEYIDWINHWEDALIFAAQLDSIPEDHSPEAIQKSAEETWNNYLYMISKVNNPDIILPVYHYGEDLSNLHRFIDFGCKYIAIGGLVGKPKKAKREFFNVLFTEIKNSSNPNVMTHAFGMTSRDLLEEFPFTSSDGTSWMYRGKFGLIDTPYGEFAVSKKLTKHPKYIYNKGQDVIDKVEQYLSKYELDLEMLDNYEYRLLLAVKQHQEWAENYKYIGKF